MMENRATFKEVEEVTRKKSFQELVSARLYQAIYKKIGAYEKNELHEYEMDYDYGAITHAQTKEQYDALLEKLMSEATVHLLDSYVVAVEAELEAEPSADEWEIETVETPEAACGTSGRPTPTGETAKVEALDLALEAERARAAFYSDVLLDCKHAVEYLLSRAERGKEDGDGADEQ